MMAGDSYSDIVNAVLVETPTPTVCQEVAAKDLLFRIAPAAQFSCLHAS